MFGKIGNAFVVLSFTASIVAMLSYAFQVYRKEEESLTWNKLARFSFFIHACSVFGIISLLFYLIQSHYFEYYYVWQHSSTTLPAKYMWACLWEGQEGSFLIWTVWHVVLSILLVWKGKKWEAPTMMFIMMIQVFLASMLLGLQFGDIKIGSNPFILLRNHPDFANLPFISMPDYLAKLKDGRGLNPLLQNYWMVIHPPTLFLGFAATAIPFAFAMGGLVTRQYREWVKPALPWTFFAISILGIGILMGGAWAYEALSFGGFWAWDPVENASLVPWITLVGGAHVMLIYKKNGTSLFTAVMLLAASFILILYSTFLTRSGILGETSVHAFTNLGMTGQLLLYMLFFIILTIVLLIVHRKAISNPTEDEALSSREFWMFMGMLVLLNSAIQITFTTSIPVINKVFGLKMAPPVDAIDFYNSWQTPLAAIIALLMAVSQFFKWKQSDWKVIAKKLAVSFVISLLVTIIFQVYVGFARVQHVVLFMTSLWAIVANVDYLIRVLKGKFSFSGGSVAHIGIGLILLGALVSNAKKETISENRLNVDLGKDFPNKENILLYQGDTLAMGEYYVTYKGKEKEGFNQYYEVEYLKANHKAGGFSKEFSLKPFIQLNERMGNVSEPATRHFLHKDIYTHVTYAEMDNKNQVDEKGYKEPKKHLLAVGDTIVLSNSLFTLLEIDKAVDKKSNALTESDIALGLKIKVTDINKKDYLIEPLFIIRGNEKITVPAELDKLGLKFDFTSIDTQANKFEVNLSEKKSNSREFIIMKALIFPGINILWIGCIMMFVGTWIAIRKQISDLKREA
jgi:cytochrome c-type biogenesis protein CcmF